MFSQDSQLCRQSRPLHLLVGHRRYADSRAVGQQGPRIRSLHSVPDLWAAVPAHHRHSVGEPDSVRHSLLSVHKAQMGRILRRVSREMGGRAGSTFEAIKFTGSSLRQLDTENLILPDLKTVSQSTFVSFQCEARNLGSGFLDDIDIPTGLHVRKIALIESGIQVYFRRASPWF